MCSSDLGITLGALDRSAEEIAAYEDLISRFGSSDAAPMQERVAKALVNKGATLGALDRSAEEIAVYDDLIARFGQSDAARLQVQVAMAMFNKGITLGALDRSAEEIAVYDDLISRFGTSDAAPLQEQVAMAQYNKGCVFARQGRVYACIEALNHWAEIRGGFACEMIANDRDFDSIRAKPKFAKYLEDKGC